MHFLMQRTLAYQQMTTRYAQVKYKVSLGRFFLTWSKKISICSRLLSGFRRDLKNLILFLCPTLNILNSTSICYYTIIKHHHIHFFRSSLKTQNTLWFDVKSPQFRIISYQLSIKSWKMLSKKRVRACAKSLSLT